MTRCLAIVALIIGGLSVGGARAACTTAFGGDDTGCIPPDADSLKYESKVGKNLSKFQKCALKCHEARASGKLPDSTTEENCEDACKGKYDLANTKLVVPTPATCLNTDALRQFWQGFLDLNNNQIYCEGSTSFGGDDTGNIPSDDTILKCEKKVGSNVAKLLKCQGKCHAKRAKGSLADATEEEGCEDACTAKYDAANAKLEGCPLCLDTVTFGGNVRSTGDSNNGQVYCAQ
jgi:hypothetical protein